jgi:hypothetical protein
VTPLEARPSKKPDRGVLSSFGWSISVKGRRDRIDRPADEAPLEQDR